jgi:alpha-amylase/alpha-mannosidase (GH57 family)
MKGLKKALTIILLANFLAACQSPEPTTTPSSNPAPEPTATPLVSPTDTTIPEEPPIYLSIIWHQHQPVYFKDPETGVYARPWVRVHAAKDYVDMAAILEQYPNVHATFNLTPSLIRQLDDLSSGAGDLYQVYAQIPAESLTDEQKQFILARFFDTNRKIVDRFPRYQELLQKRDTSADPLHDYRTEDFRDLQVLFNLAWTDPDWLAAEPLAALVVKGSGYSEEEKAILFAEHLRLVQEVIPIHKRLQDSGQIEITTTPFAHPILPLLVNTDLAREALPDLELPSTPFVFGQDAVAQVNLGAQLYQEHFGQPPRGMWPSEGSVAQEIVTMVARNGIQWMASDESVLANSLGLNGFSRDSNEVVVEADVLYRPYYVEGRDGGPVAMVFRDRLLSDKVGFTYSGMGGEAAAADFIQRIHAIRENLEASGGTGPHLVSVILDGENAWEHYDNDGKEFLHTLYQLLNSDPLIVTVTPSEFLQIAPEQPEIEDLWAGSWHNADFAIWIGEEEENTAWDYLTVARQHLQAFISGSRKGEVTEEILNEAQLLMYISEGSDWFWYLGADWDSGQDETFDQQFRDTLKQVYLTLGDDPPQFLDVPIIPQQAVTADRPSSGLVSPLIDGRIEAEEWAAAAEYSGAGSVLAPDNPGFESLAYGFDGQNIYFGITLEEAFPLPAEETHIELYLNIPGGGAANDFTRAGTILGFPAEKLVDIHLTSDGIAAAQQFSAQGDDNWQLEAEIEQAALGERQLELSLPLTQVGNPDFGDRFRLRAFLSQVTPVDERVEIVDLAQVPGAGPAEISVPDLGTSTVVLEVSDPEEDDHGTGNYAYPMDAVFASGNFDILAFQVASSEEQIIFKFSLRGPVDNPWGSPNGLSLQTFDVYIDKDGDGQGGIALLPGRNLSLAEGEAWDYAITAEGWEPGIFIPGADGPQQVASANEFEILVDPDQREVTIRVPKAILGEQPEAWRFTALVLSQEGFPSGGVMRVRDVNPLAEQWRIGGAPANSTNHTRALDLVWPEAGQQEAWLSDISPTGTPQTELAAEDFARISLFGADNIE